MTDTALNLTIASLSAIATIAAAIIYYLTLGELKKQRENTYKPHLFIDNIYFYVQGIRKNNFFFPSKWEDKPNAGTFIEFHQNNEIGFSDYSLKCYNIGFGTAKQIVINFHYDIDEFIGHINLLNTYAPKECLITIKKEKHFIVFDCPNKEIPFTNGAISIEGVQANYLSYVLPVSVKADFVSIRLPLHFLEFINVYVFLFSSIENKQEKDIQLKIPILTLTIQYSDISNQQFFTSMTITTEIRTFSVAGYSGEFKVYEKNSRKMAESVNKPYLGLSKLLNFAFKFNPTV